MKKRGLGVIFVAVIIVVGIFALFHSGNDADRHRPEGVAIEDATETEHSSPTENDLKEQVSGNEKTELSADEWKETLLDAMDLSGMEAEITGDGNTMVLSGQLPKEKVNTWLSEADSDSASMYASILTILPDTISVDFTFQIGCEGGKLKLSGDSIEAAGIDIPNDVMSEEVWSEINNRVNTSLQERISNISSVEVHDGGITLQG